VNFDWTHSPTFSGERRAVQPAPRHPSEFS
jgi:hypothetical protein